GVLQDDLARFVLIEWIAQEMNRGGGDLKFGLAGIADLPSVILYFLDKSIAMYNEPKQRDQIAAVIRGEVDSLREFIFSEHGKKVLKQNYVTYDDIADFFETKEFLDLYEQAGADKTAFYNALTPEVKTFHDKVGYWSLFKNLWPVIFTVFAPAVWVFIDPLLFQSTFPHQGLLRGLFLVSSVVAWLAPFFYLFRTDRRWLDKTSVKEILSFLLLYYPLTIGVWGVASYYFNYKMWDVFHAFWMLGYGWGAYLGLPNAYIVGLSTVLGLFILPTVVGVFFIYYRLTRVGMGQVKNWKDVQREYLHAKDRFVELILPKEVAPRWQGREEQIWEKF